MDSRTASILHPSLSPRRSVHSLHQHLLMSAHMESVAVPSRDAHPRDSSDAVVHSPAAAAAASAGSAVPAATAGPAWPVDPAAALSDASLAQGLALESTAVATVSGTASTTAAAGVGGREH
jgi:hypothetical protein